MYFFVIQSSWRPSDANRFRAEASFRGGGGSSNANANTAYTGSSRVRGFNFFSITIIQTALCSQGVIYCLAENGSCMEVLQADGAVRK